MVFVKRLFVGIITIVLFNSSQTHAMELAMQTEQDSHKTSTPKFGPEIILRKIQEFLKNNQPNEVKGLLAVLKNDTIILLLPVACRVGFADVAKAILEAVYDDQFILWEVLHKSIQGKKALGWAISYEQEDIIKEILNTMNKRGWKYSGWESIKYALTLKKLAMVTLLLGLSELEHGLTRLKNYEKDDLVEVAYQTGNQEIIDVLINA